MKRVVARLMIAGFTFLMGVGLVDLGISFGNRSVTSSEFELVRTDAVEGDGTWIYQASDRTDVLYSKSNLYIEGLFYSTPFTRMVDKLDQELRAGGRVLETRLITGKNGEEVGKRILLERMGRHGWDTEILWTDKSGFQTIYSSSRKWALEFEKAILLEMLPEKTR